VRAASASDAHFEGDEAFPHIEGDRQALGQRYE